MEFNISNLSWAIQRALNYNVISKIRVVSYDIAAQNTYNLKIIVDADLSDDERDIIYSIDGEVIGDFDRLVHSNLEVVIDQKTNIMKLVNLEHIAYARYEEGIKL